MKPMPPKRYLIAACIVTAAALVLLEGQALASGGARGWRGTYDTVMMWLNFGIIVFLVLRYVKAPLLRFLEGRKEEVSEQLKAVENRRREFSEKVSQVHAELEGQETHFQELKERAVEAGRKRKEEIIEEAKQDAQRMMEDARLRIEVRLAEARRKYKAELIEMSVARALERLPSLISAQDNQRLVERYLDAALGKSS